MYVHIYRPPFGVRSRHAVVVNVLEYNINAREFEFQSCYYVHFQTNTLGNGMEPLIHPLMGWVVPLLSF